MTIGVVNDIFSRERVASRATSRFPAWPHDVRWYKRANDDNTSSP
jgi:hypothetical protein